MKKIFFSSIVLGVFLFNATEISAQGRVLQGTVSDADDGEMLPGVSIMILESGRGTTTDVDGNFKLNLNEGDSKVQFSFIGYKTQTIEIGTLSSVDVVLEPDIQSLDELVVIGYGSVRKSDLTGSVSSVKSEELVKIPASNPAMALQGKVAGLQVNAASGAPGAQPVVRIRGVGTFNNSAPIYVVDGVILDDISFLTAADIESMEVLKDASATAIYGSRGANGVIMVTTKKGKRGKASIQVNTEFSIQTVPDPIALLDGRQFATIANEIRPGSYNNPDLVPDTDWQSLLFNPAAIQNHQVSASGSKDDLTYFMSVGYYKQEGIIEKSDFERLTVRLNNEYRLNKNITIGNNLSIAPFWQQNTNGNVVFQAYRAQPVIEPFNDDGSYAEVPGVGNPFAAINYTNSFSRGIRTVGNLYAQIDIAEGLNFRSSASVDLNSARAEDFTPVFFVSPQQQNDISRLNKSFSQTSMLLWENTLNYSKEISNKHRINALLGFTMQDTRSESFGVGAWNILRDDPGFWYINPNNINPNTVSNIPDINLNYSMLSYLGRINYAYDDRYLATVSVRTDGSSKFVQGNRFSVFPSAAIGWNLSNEPFFEEIYGISNLKLRASWGVTGNEKIPYWDIYSRVFNQLDAVFGREPELNNGATFGSLGNEDLRWETTHQTDIGLEISLFNNRLTAEADYFNRVTRDILIPLINPGYWGNGQGATTTFNAASVLNRGFEFSLSYQDQFGDIAYKIGAIGNTLHNEVLEISGADEEAIFGGAVFNQFVTRSIVGLPMFHFYGYEVDGIFQNQQELDAYPHQSAASVGDLRYVDQNGDGVINTDDRVMIGSPIPDFIYGFNLDLSYKNFSLNADFQGELGKQLYNAKDAVRPDLYNFEAYVWDRWTGEGTSNVQPRPTAGGYNWQPSERFVQNGSYLRLRNVTLGYTLPRDITDRLKLQHARIYASAVNMFTLTRFTGYSPEFGTENDAANGLDFGGYPVTAIYSLGMNLTF